MRRVAVLQGRLHRWPAQVDARGLVAATVDVRRHGTCARTGAWRQSGDRRFRDDTPDRSRRRPLLPAHHAPRHRATGLRSGRGARNGSPADPASDARAVTLHGPGRRTGCRRRRSRAAVRGAFRAIAALAGRRALRPSPQRRWRAHRRTSRCPRAERRKDQDSALGERARERRSNSATGAPAPSAPCLPASLSCSQCNPATSITSRLYGRSKYARLRNAPPTA